MGSTLRNLSNGRTASLTKNLFGKTGSKSCSSRLTPNIDFMAAFTRDDPIALDINGTVLDALGLTSMIKISLSLTAYWIFISPIMLSSLAIAIDCLEIVS